MYVPQLRVCAVLVALASSVAACGSDDDKQAPSSPTATTGERSEPASRDRARQIWPKPAESAHEAVARLAAAARTSDCRDPSDLFHVDGRAGFPRGVCQRVLSTLELTGPDAVETYGSGAVAANGDGGHTILALHDDGRYKLATIFHGGGRLEVPVRLADDAMAYAVSAIRRDNCEELLEIALTYEPQGTGKAFCARPRLRRLHRALDSAYTAQPALLGSDGTFAFYGVRAKGHGYFTLLFIAHANGGYAFVDSFKGG